MVFQKLFENIYELGCKDWMGIKKRFRNKIIHVGPGTVCCLPKHEIRDINICFSDYCWIFHLGVDFNSKQWSFNWTCYWY